MTYLFPEVKPRPYADRMARKARRDETLRRTDPAIAFEARRDDVLRRCRKRDCKKPQGFVKSIPYRKQG